MAASDADSGSPSRTDILALFVLVAAAGALRWSAWVRSAAIFDDGPRFLAIARALDAGAWSLALRDAFHPLYPLATVGIHRALALVDSAPGWETAGALVSVVASSAAVGFLFLFVRDAFGRPPAWIAAGLLAVHSRAIDYGSDVQSDGLYLGLFAAGIWAGWRALRDRSPAAAAGAGAAAGLAYLTRPEGLGLALVLGALGALAMARRRWSWRAGAGWLAALGIAALLCAAPYVLALHQWTGAWTLTHKKSVAGMVRGEVAPTPGAPVEEARAAAAERATAPAAAPPVLSPGVDASADPARVPPPPPPWLQALHLSAPVTVDASWLDPEYLDQDGLRVALASSRAERAGEALRMLGRHVRSALRYGVAVLAAFGLLAAAGRPGLRGGYSAALAGLYLVVLYALTLSSGYVSRRHALPPLLPLFGYAGLGALALGTWLARGLRAPTRAGRVGALVVAAVAAGELASQSAPKRLEELAMRRAAEWLHANASAPGPVAAPRQRFGYYAGMPYIPLAGVADESLARYLSRTQARYVLLEDADQVATLRRAEGSGVRLLHQVEVAGVPAFVLERKPAGPPVRAPNPGTAAEP
ncbi:MAG: glycosyltransferase family 39 protein [Myxococcota bacterium]|nr:glycosyltransferase family 39 protein [Myxococcota bacterium]